MRIGILGTADIAFRRFLPALKKCPEFTYAGVASRTPLKAARFAETYGGQAYPLMLFNCGDYRTGALNSNLF